MGRPKGIGKGCEKWKPLPMSERMATFSMRFNRAGFNECWIWIGAVDKKIGYGRFSWNTNTTTAHRFAYLVAHGSIPQGMLICHKCDNRICVNPNHLFAGTIKENNQDMWNKGRGRIKTRANITPEQVIQIRRMYKPFVMTYKMISEKLGVPYKSVDCALQKNKWKSVPWD